MAAAAPSSSPLHARLHALGLLPFSGSQAVEIGSGSGVAGLAAAALGMSVLLTDVPSVVPLLEHNAQLNQAAIARAGGAARVQVCEWERPEALPDGAALVLAADVLYQRDGRQLEALCDVVRRLMAPCDARPQGGVLLLAHKARHTALDEAIPEALQQAGVALDEIPFELHHPEFRSPTVKVFLGRVADAHVEGVALPDKCPRN